MQRCAVIGAAADLLVHCSCTGEGQDATERFEIIALLGRWKGQSCSICGPHLHLAGPLMHACVSAVGAHACTVCACSGHCSCYWQPCIVSMSRCTGVADKALKQSTRRYLTCQGGGDRIQLLGRVGRTPLHRFGSSATAVLQAGQQHVTLCNCQSSTPCHLILLLVMVGWPPNALHTPACTMFNTTCCQGEAHMARCTRHWTAALARWLPSKSLAQQTVMKTTLHGYTRRCVCARACDAKELLVGCGLGCLQNKRAVQQATLYRGKECTSPALPISGL